MILLTSNVIFVRNIPPSLTDVPPNTALKISMQVRALGS
jgi:hypothetical protein